MLRRYGRLLLALYVISDAMLGIALDAVVPTTLVDYAKSVAAGLRRRPQQPAK